MVLGTHRPWREGEILIREAKKEDAEEISVKLAKEDVAELYAVSGLDPKIGMLRCHAISDESWVAETDGDGVVAMWGLIADEGPAANVWLTCAPVVKKAPISFSRIVKEQILNMANTHGVLYCYADARNTDHLRWLRRIGFHRTRVIFDFGFEKRTFHEFVGGAA